jgi:hypothetical protein
VRAVVPEYQTEIVIDFAALVDALMERRVADTNNGLLARLRIEERKTFLDSTSAFLI